MKKIVYIYGNLPAYRKDFFTILKDALLENNIEMKVLYGNVMNKEVLQDENSKYPTTKLKTRFLNLRYIKLSRMTGLLKHVKSEFPDAIIFQFNQTNISQWSILFHCIRKNIPFAIWGCNYTRSALKPALVKIRNRIYKFIYKHSSHFIPYGTLYQKHLIELGIPEDKITVAQNTINIEKIIASSNKNKHTFGETTKILYVGALAPQKLVESSIKAVASLVNDGYKITFDIVGGGDTHSIKKCLIGYSDNIKNSIFIHGPRYDDDVKIFFENADVFLMPGTGGLAINEAMAYGLPIISTLGDETVIDLLDGNGFLLKQFGDVDEQIAIIKKFIALSHTEKQKMSKRSISLIQARATIKNMVIKHVQVCRDLVNMNS